LAKIVPTGETYYRISDGDAAPLIEYIHSKIVPSGTLTRGRVWADMYGLNDDKTKLVYKGDAFEKWYEGMARWLRRNLIRVKGVQGYFGKQALEWFREGGRVGDSYDWVTWDQIADRQ
jgi:hypothetical protein